MTVKQTMMANPAWLSSDGKLVGELLREMSPLSRWQIVEGLREQVIARDRGEHRRLGEILVSRGYVSTPDLDRALRRQTTDRRGS